jgi:AsmA protein
MCENKGISMGKLLKFVLWLVGALVLLVVIAAVVLPMVIDPNDYKDEIAAAVEEQTGRILSIEGDIGLSVFPWLGLDIGPTQLSNATGFAEASMARMQAVQVRVKLLPLLRKQLEVDKVLLAGLQLNLAKDKQGRSNWDDLGGAPKDEPAAVAKEKPAAKPADKDEGSLIDTLTIGGVEISDAQINWYDGTTDTRYVVNELSLTTGAIVPGEAFELDMRMLLSASQPPVDTRVALRGEILLAADFGALSISGARLQIDASGDSLPGGELNATLSTDISLGIEEQTLLLPNLKLETLGMAITGSVTGNAISSEAPRFNGSFAIEPFSPRDLLQALGEAVPETADANVLTRADANLAWDATLQAFSVTTLTAHVDESTLGGTLKVNNFEAPAITFDFDLDQIDLDRYLPPPAEGDAAADSAKADKAAKQGKGKAATEELPLEPLRQLDLNGDIRIGQLKAFNLRTTDVKIKISADDGVLKVSPLTANLYEGAVDLDLRLDARMDTPKISVKETLTGVQAGPLLKDLTGSDTLLGKATVKADLVGTGADADAIKKTLNGSASFSFKEGAINGVNIAAIIREAQAVLQGQPAPKQEGPNRTDFALLKGSATIKNGVVKNDDLKMKSPLLRISGAGKASLPAETIDYTLTTKFVGSLEGQGGKGDKKLSGVAIPVHVGGTFNSPTYTPDLGALASEAAKKEVDKRIKKEQKKLEKKLGKDVPDDLLKGLFDK